MVGSSLFAQWDFHAARGRNEIRPSPYSVPPAQVRRKDSSDNCSSANPRPWLDSSQTPVISATDTYPLVGDNAIDLHVRAKVCPSTKTSPEATQPDLAGSLFDNLRRLAGVSGSGIRSRMPNEKRTESHKSLFL